MFLGLSKCLNLTHTEKTKHCHISQNSKLHSYMEGASQGGSTMTLSMLVRNAKEKGPIGKAHQDRISTVWTFLCYAFSV